MSFSTAPIKIDTSMTEMAVSPNMGPLSSPSSPQQGSTSDSESTWGSPKSSVTPTSIGRRTPFSSPFDSPKPKTPKYDFKASMQQRGYIPSKSLGTTLQGSIWKCKSNVRGKRSVIKVTKKSLYNKSVAVVDGTEIAIKEDVIKETAILRYLSSDKKAPKQLARFEKFFSDKQNYFLVMEDGGNGLFEFVAKCHRFIQEGKLEIAEWHRFCKMAFKQMVDLLDWMHNKMSTCHLDISLENFVIDNVMVMVDKKRNKIQFADSFVIKIVDFGLAEVFTKCHYRSGKTDFSCSKYVGKTAYKAPKVHAQQHVFNASAADCWSLGIVLFMMIIGGAPYSRPSKSDVAFRYIIGGKLIQLLDEWDRVHFVTPALIDLFNRILTKEEKRINIEEIKKHPWLL